MLYGWLLVRSVIRRSTHVMSVRKLGMDNVHAKWGSIYSLAVCYPYADAKCMLWEALETAIKADVSLNDGQCIILGLRYRPLRPCR